MHQDSTNIEACAQNLQDAASSKSWWVDDVLRPTWLLRGSKNKAEMV